MKSMLYGNKRDLPVLRNGEGAVCEDVEEIHFGKNNSSIVVASLDKTNQYANTLYYQSKPLEALPGNTKTQYVYDFYDALIDAYPDYITKTLLGKDSSNTYDIYMYDFKPPAYKNTVILNGIIHGNERYGGVGLAHALKSICEDWSTNSILADLRWNTRFKVVGMLNPWGLENNSRLNVNSVDINRNFEHIWSNSASTEKGSAPLSEVEAQYINQVFNETPEAVLFLDFHCGPHDGKNFVLFNPSAVASPIIKTRQASLALLDIMLRRNSGTTGSLNISAYPDNQPTLSAQSTMIKGIPVGYTVEWGDSSENYPMSNVSEEIKAVSWTKCVEFMINAIYISLQVAVRNINPLTYERNPVWDLMPQPGIKTIDMFNDFNESLSTTELRGWNLNVAEEGTASANISIADEVGGWVQLDTDDANNDYTKLQYSAAAFKLVPGKRLAFEAKIKTVTENPLKVGFLIGLTKITADVASTQGIYFRKSFSSPDDVIRCSAYTTTALQTYSDVVLQSETEYKLSFRYDGERVYYYIDDRLITTRPDLVINEMLAPTLWIQNGSALAGNKLLVDYIKVMQER